MVPNLAREKGDNQLARLRVVEKIADDLGQSESVDDEGVHRVTRIGDLGLCARIGGVDGAGLDNLLEVVEAALVRIR